MTIATVNSAAPLQGRGSSLKPRSLEYMTLLYLQGRGPYGASILGVNGLYSISPGTRLFYEASILGVYDSTVSLQGWGSSRASKLGDWLYYPSLGFKHKHKQGNDKVFLEHWHLTHSNWKFYNSSTSFGKGSSKPNQHQQDKTYNFSCRKM